MSPSMLQRYSDVAAKAHTIARSSNGCIVFMVMVQSSEIGICQNACLIGEQWKKVQSSNFRLLKQRSAEQDKGWIEGLQGRPALATPPSCCNAFHGPHI